MENLIESIFDLSDNVRHVAIYSGEDLASGSRPGPLHFVLTRARDPALRRSRLAGQTPSSEGEIDRYEELLVNPILLLMARQRGRIDCGGLQHVLVGYGDFDQLNVPLEKGHVSICLEQGVDHERFRQVLAPVLRAFQARPVQDA